MEEPPADPDEEPDSDTGLTCPDDSPLRAPLILYTRRLVPNPEDAEDIVQEAFWRMLAAPRYPRFPESWLKTTIRRMCIDRARERRRVQSAPLDSVAEIVAAQPDPVTGLVQQEQMSVLQQVLESLSEPHQAVVRLVLIHDWSGPEIEKRTGIAASTVRQIVRRFRQRVQRILEDTGE